MRRSTAVLLILTITTLLLAATAGSAGGEGRRWPKTGCTTEPPDRPTILSAYFQGRTDGASWRYGEAREALEGSGVPTRVFERNGRRWWSEFAYAGGVAGRLVPAGRRLRNYDPPRPSLARPQVFFDCAGREDNPRTFLIKIPADIHAREVVNDHGGRERIVDRLFRYEGARWWVLRRRPQSGTVQRMLVYLRDERVISIEMERSGTVAH